MNFENFEYSKTKVRKAAKSLVKNNLDFKEKIDAISILANFRSAHSYPMQSMINYFRKKSFEVDKKAIVVRRLKRIPSIISKLKRLPTMQVSTMGDIGGIRIILEDVEKVNQLRDKLLKGKTSNKLLSEKNYIENPKESGYRSLHLNYSYQGSKAVFKGFRVELQIRSKIQHSWATAVEVAGTLHLENLKASEGSNDWLTFFKLVSQGFAKIERKEVVDKALKEAIMQQEKSLRAFGTLSSFSFVPKYSKGEKGFYLLELDAKEKLVTITHYTDKLLDSAYDNYRRIEQEISEDLSKNVVLVSSQSIKELKKAYPNYFTDTQVFLKNLTKIMD